MKTAFAIAALVLSIASWFIFSPTTADAQGPQLAQGLLDRLLDERRNRRYQRRFEQQRPVQRSRRSSTLSRYQRHYRNEARVRRIQSTLNALGYSVGGADGKVGGKSVRGIMRWQRKNGYFADGFMTQEQVSALFNMLRQQSAQLRDLYVIVGEKMALGKDRSIVVRCKSGGVRTIVEISATRWRANRVSVEDGFHNTAVKACRSI